MRIFKIILILITIVSLLFMSLAMFYLEKVFGGNSGYFIVLIFVVLGFVLSLLTLFYHIKSFRYYRKSKPYKEETKTVIVLRFCAITFGIYYILFGGFSLVGTMTDEESDEAFVIIAFMLFILFGIFSIYETILLRKRIKRLQNEQETKDEIETIGN